MVERRVRRTETELEKLTIRMGHTKEVLPLCPEFEPFDITPDDAAIHQRIYAELDLPEQADNALLDPATPAEFLEMCRNARFIKVVANRATGELAGYALMKDWVHDENRTIYIDYGSGFRRFAKTLEIDSIVIREQGKGLGSWLLVECEKTARDNGYEAVTLKTHYANSALDFYRMHGYRVSESVAPRSSDRYELVKFFYSEDIKKRTHDRTEEISRLSRLNRVLAGLTVNIDVANPLPQSEGRFKRALARHLRHYMEMEARTQAAEATSLSKEQRELIIGKIVTYLDESPTVKEASGFRKTQYTASQMDISVNEFRRYREYEDLLERWRRKMNTQPLATFPLTPPLPAEGVNIEMHPLIRKQADSLLTHNGVSHGPSPDNTLRKLLYSLARVHSSEYMNTQIVSLFQQLNANPGLLPDASEDQRRLSVWRALVVFDQLSLYPSQAQEDILRNPLVQQCPSVLQQKVLELVALRAWNVSTNAQTVARLLHFAQDHADNSAMVSRRFAARFTDLVPTGYEGQAVKLLELLPAILPEAQMQEILKSIESHGYWNVALEVGRRSSVI